MLRSGEDDSSEDAEAGDEQPDATLDQVVRLLQSAKGRKKLDDAVLYMQELVGQQLPRLANRVLRQEILEQALTWCGEE